MPDENRNGMSLRCPHCDGKSRFDSTLSGHVVDCPHCGKELTVPEAPAQQYQQAPAPQPYQQAPGAPPYQQAPAPQQNPYSTETTSRSGGISTALSNPLEGQPQAMAEMGTGATLRWGWGLGGIWIISSWLSSWQIGSTLFGTLPTSIRNFGTSAKAGPKLSDHIEWIAGAAIPFLCLVLILLALRAMGNMRVKFGAIVFTSAIVMLPLLIANLFLFFSSFMDISTADGAKVMSHIFFFVLAFVIASVIMLIKASLVSVLGFAPRRAFWLVPLVLVSVGYLSMWTNSLLTEMTN